jgi:hypothetical protein
MIPATSTFQTALATFRAGKLPAVITIAGYSRVFTKGLAAPATGQYQWLVSVDDFATSINDLDGGANTATLGFAVQDRGGAITADFPGFVFEGKLVTLQIGLPGLALTDFPVFFTGYIDSVASNNGNTEYYFLCSDTSTKLAKVIYTEGDSGNPTDSSNPRTLNGNPMDMLLEILGTEVGLTTSFYDVATIEAYRDTIFSGVNFLFHLTAPPAAADFIKNQIMKPLGGYMWVNSAGKISVKFFYPLAGPVAVQTLGPSTWTTLPVAEQTDMVNTVLFQFDADASGSSNYRSNDTESYGPSVAMYDTYGELTIASDGMRSAFQGFSTAHLVARMVFMRYGFKNLKFDQNAPDAHWQACRLEPGDIVAVTHPNVPDRQAGVMGITAKLFEVLDRTIKFNTGLCMVTLLDATYLSSFGLFLIAPTGEDDWTTASSPDKAKYMFMSDDTGKYSDGATAHILG